MTLLSFQIPSYLPAILLVAALIVAGVVSYRLWAEMTEEIEPASNAELLAELEQAYAEGGMDEVEFHRVRELLDPTKTLRKGKLDLDKERERIREQRELSRRMPSVDAGSSPNSETAE